MSDLFERNLERLIRAAADPPPDAARARRVFLSRVEGKAPFHVRLGRMTAMAASLVAAAAILYSALAPRPQEKPGTAPQGPPSLVETPPASPDGTPSGSVMETGPRAVVAAPGAPSAPMVAKDETMTLSCILPAPRATLRSMQFEGVVAWPERTTLKVTVQRLEESCSGGRLAPVGALMEGGSPEVRQKNFQYSATWSGPGRYLVTVKIDESQRPEVDEAVKKLPKRTCTFEFAGWGTDLAGQIGPKFREVDLIAKECADLVARVEKAASKESGWVKERRNVDERGADVILTKEAEELLKETSRLSERLVKSDVKTLFPATFHELYFTLQGMHGNARNYVYEKGKFAGAGSYHAKGEPLKTHRQDAFNFEALKKYVDEAVPLAGRECALWVVKDLRRGGELAPHSALLKAEAKHAGLEPYAGRLATAVPADFEALEASIRAGK